MRILFFLLIPLICRAQIELEEEALALRRIADFWQEGEYQIAKSQIEEYLKEFPQSSHSDTLSAALGDLWLREKNYSNALNYYSQIQSDEGKALVFLNRMQCLYQLEWYATLADECETFLSKELPEEAKIEATYYLAISLYQQCLNASKEPQLLEKLALRAQPYFATLFESKLSSEVSQAFAHLCCILKDFPKASQIYLDLAEQDEAEREDLLFQAAMLQAEFDKEKAAETFETIANLHEKRGPDAAFNQVVLQFELGHHMELASSKEALMAQISPERLPRARLFLARSFLALEKYAEAAAELKELLGKELPSELVRAAAVHLLDAAQKIGDGELLNLAIATLDPQDPEKGKALFARAMLLKKEGKIKEAKEELCLLVSSEHPFSQNPQAAFELAHLEYRDNAWEECRSRADFFVNHYPSHELSPFAWRYLISASAQLASQEAPDQHRLKEQLAADLETFLERPLPEAEKGEWQFLLAKTYFELNRRERALSLLSPLLESSFPQQANAHLLMALLQKEQFCELAEKALSMGANLIEPSQIHISLFNAYLEKSNLDLAADHLFSAFRLKNNLQIENLQWLADYYDRKSEKDQTAALRAIELFEHSPQTEETLYKLAKLYSFQNRTVEQVTLLEKAEKKSLLPEAQLLLAEGYLRLGRKTEAAELFQAIVSDSPTIRNPISASASLQSIRLKRAQGEISSQLASSLKNLILQRSLANEPIHLEAALEYIDLQSEKSLEKRLSLLTKVKSDFESTTDLLSRDYQEARRKLPEKEEIYKGYMNLFDAEILLCQAGLASEVELQKELKAKAKTFLLQINEGAKESLLTQHVRGRLQQLNGNEPAP